MNTLKPIFFIVILLSPLSFSKDLYEIGKNAYVVQGGNGKGANVGVILDGSETILVDAMTEESRSYLIEKIALVTNNPVSIVLSTHDHFDHTGSNQYFSEKGAMTISSRNFESENNRRNIKIDGHFSLIGNEIEVVGHSINSHSASDVLYFFPSLDVVFIGDIYADEWYPSFFSGGIKGQLEAIQLALSLGTQDTKYVPGHGKLIGKENLKAYALLCEKWFSRIKFLHTQGLDSKAITKDAELLKLREGFASENTNRENFDFWFEKIIENTVNSI